MRAVEIIALFFVILVLVKLAVIMINPQKWKSVVKTIYTQPQFTMLFGLGLAAVIFYYLQQEMTIVQIFAAMTFMMALMMVQFGALGHEIIELSDKFLDNRSILKKVWLSLSIWLILIAWVLFEIFV